MTTSIESLLAELTRRWHEQGVPVLPGASESQLRAFESTHKVQCPGDFATYLCTLGGMLAGAMDEHLVRFWPLTEIQPVSETTDPAGPGRYFVFADYSISAFEYAIRLSTSTESAIAIIGGHAPMIVSSTFAEFLMVYLTDPMSIL
jgi:hypothetical protein